MFAPALGSFQPDPSGCDLNIGLRHQQLHSSVSFGQESWQRAVQTGALAVGSRRSSLALEERVKCEFWLDPRLTGACSIHVSLLNRGSGHGSLPTVNPAAS